MFPVASAIESRLNSFSPDRLVLCSYLGSALGRSGGLGAAGLDAEDGGAAGSLGGSHGLGDLDTGEGGRSSDHREKVCALMADGTSTARYLLRIFSPRDHQ